MAHSVAATCVGVAKIYPTSSGQVEALQDIDARIPGRAMTAVVGVSGSGKSTLLNLMAGLDRPTRGEIVVQGRRANQLSSGELQKLRRELVTYIFQRPGDNLVPQLSLREHAWWIASCRDRRDSRSSALELFERFGIAHRLDHKPPDLSGGEQARAAFALALLRQTPLIIADEPTAELDAKSTDRLLETVGSSAAEGVSLILATHDPRVVARADHVLRLERGCLVTPGTTLGSPRPELPRRGGLSVTRTVVTRGLTKTFSAGSGVTRAVSRVSIELRRGELVALLGPSGSGKSTLLSLLAGWQKPDDGEIVVTVQGMSSTDPSVLGWWQLAMVPQRFGLLDELTLRENIQHPSRIAGHLDFDRDWIEALLRGLALHEVGARFPSEVSIGQQQRTALARALALKPSIVLADEPTAHQDAGSRDMVLRVLRRAAAAGASCLVATHERAVVRYADTVWEIEDGRIAGRRQPDFYE